MFPATNQNSENNDTSSPESIFMGRNNSKNNSESQGSSGSSRQPRVSLFQKAVRNTIIEQITRNKSFNHMNKSLTGASVNPGGLTLAVSISQGRNIDNSNDMLASVVSYEECKGPLIEDDSATN